MHLILSIIRKLLVKLFIMDTPFKLTQLFDASIENVWEALTDESRMRAWYFPQLEKFEPIVGYQFKFTDDGSAYKKEWRVTQVEPGKKLSHSWVYKGYPGSSEVSFEISESEGKTKLHLTHTGLSSFPKDAHFARHRFEEGWKRIIGSNLKDHLENDHK
jgi:uncharacterized protein YndB with AHSA1/START domain